MSYNMSLPKIAAPGVVFSTVWYVERTAQAMLVSNSSTISVRGTCVLHVNTGSPEHVSNDRMDPFKDRIRLWILNRGVLTLESIAVAEGLEVELKFTSVIKDDKF